MSDAENKRTELLWTLFMDLTAGNMYILSFDSVSEEPFGWTRGRKST